MEHASGPTRERTTMTTAANNDSRDNEVSEKLKGWESFVKGLGHLQYFHDYLNDLHARQSLGKVIHELSEPDIREALIARLKSADEIFIGFTDLFPRGLVGWPPSLHPDTDWFFARKPRVTDSDFPK